MKSDELAMLCGALSIKEKERQVGILDSNLIEKGVHLLSLCLVGKVLINRLVNKDALINVLATIWRTNEGVEFEPLEGILIEGENNLGDGQAQVMDNCADKKLSVQEEVHGREVRPENVTSSEVSALVEEAPSYLQSAGQSLSARRVQ
ncbi:hypothetical protein Q3G72_033041 [Acer saccharum]|nr:hypothetical protein Q3G72_033041 [Acer saccharum]